MERLTERWQLIKTRLPGSGLCHLFSSNQHTRSGHNFGELRKRNGDEVAHEVFGDFDDAKVQDGGDDSEQAELLFDAETKDVEGSLRPERKFQEVWRCD